MLWLHRFFSTDCLLWSAGHHFPDTDPRILPCTLCSNDYDDKCSSVILEEDIGQFCWIGLDIKNKYF
jgi:hypothetical protein